jgi:hypothetical protein
MGSESPALTLKPAAGHLVLYCFVQALQVAGYFSQADPKHPRTSGGWKTSGAGYCDFDRADRSSGAPGRLTNALDFALLNRTQKLERKVDIRRLHPAYLGVDALQILLQTTYSDLDRRRNADAYESPDGRLLGARQISNPSISRAQELRE